MFRFYKIWIVSFSFLGIQSLPVANIAKQSYKPYNSHKQCLFNWIHSSFKRTDTCEACDKIIREGARFTLYCNEANTIRLQSHWIMWLDLSFFDKQYSAFQWV